MRDSQHGQMLPVVVDSFPIDESPYGVRGLAGNMADWCANGFQEDDMASSGSRLVVPSIDQGDWPQWTDHRSVRGGFWGTIANETRSSQRSEYSPGYRCFNNGIRLIRSMP